MKQFFFRLIIFSTFTISSCSTDPSNNQTSDSSTTTEGKKQMSKEEIENWILEKLNKYAIPYTITTDYGSSTPTTSLNYFNSNFSFQNDYLIITNKANQRFVNSKMDFHFEMQCDITRKILVSDIKSISADSANKKLSTNYITLHYESNAQRYSATCTTVTNGKTEKSEYNSTSDPFYLGFRIDAEKDLVPRLIKAFSSLKDVYEAKEEIF